MQIVIKIPDVPIDDYQDLFNKIYGMAASEGLFDDKVKSQRALALKAVLDILGGIVNGVPLPKEHGRLIDTDELVKEICIEYKANSIYELPDEPDELRSFIKKYLNEAPTILKPTTEYMIKNYAFSKSEG